MQFYNKHSFVKNKAIKMILMSYWSISGVLTSDREVLLIYFLELLKNSTKYKISLKKIMFCENITPNFFRAYFEKNLSVTS